MMVEHTMPILLGAESRSSPAEINNRIRSMGDRLVRPQAHLTGARGHPNRLPTAGAGLFLHHPERFSFEPTRRIMPQSKISMVCFLHQMPASARIVIPGHEIQRFRQVVIVDLVEAEAHKIMGDKMRRAKLAQDIHLLLLEACKSIRHKAPEIQIQPRVGNATGFHWNWNLRPVSIDVTPKGGAPGCVELLQRTITDLQPVLKTRLAIGAITTT